MPTIAFGVPAGASMALLLSAFLMHGLVPGPEMLTKHLDVTYSIIWTLTIAHIMGAVHVHRRRAGCSRGWRRCGPGVLLPLVLDGDLHRRLSGLAKLGRSLFARRSSARSAG